MNERIYVMEVCRSSCKVKTFEVQATTEASAWEKAEEMAHDYDFSEVQESGVEYVVTQEDVRDLPPQEPPEPPEPTLYHVLHVYGNGVTQYRFRSYKAFGGWCGPGSDAPPKEVLDALDIDFQPECGETLDISPVDDGEIKLI